MTRPDPYIEEVMSNFDKEFTYNGVKGDYRLKITSAADLKSFIRTALEAQKSATKTQRIKDIEEIEEAIQNAPPEAITLGMDAIEGDYLRELLTSRKAAIEEV